MKNVVGLILCAGVLFASAAEALAQGPPAVQPSDTQATDTAAAQLAERVRKLEEMNQQLLEQFSNVSTQYQDVTRQNAELSKTVQDLSRKLEQAPAGVKPGASGTGGAGAGGAGGGGAGGDFEPPITGGLTSPPVGDAGAPKGKKRNRLNGFYDEDYRERYGYVFQTEDAEYELRLNGLVQVDSRSYDPQNQVPVANGFNMPRTRIYFSGRLTKPIEYQISFQRTNNNFDLLNGYFNFRYDERLQMRFGRFRAVYTYEWSKLSTWELPTPERSPFAMNFGPNRQIGFMGWGNILKNRVEYAVGMFDGPRNSFQDFNNAKDVMAFVDFRPFIQGDSALKYLSFGGSMDQGQQDNPTVPAALRASQNAGGYATPTGGGDSLIASPFLQFNADVREKGDRALWEVHATYFYQGLSVLAAWESGFNDFSRTATFSRPVHLPVGGFYVGLGYILTGEKLQKRALFDPIHPFDLRKGKFGLGAFEVQGRFSQLEVGDEIFTGGLSDPNLWANRLNLTDLGFNWYLNRNLKFIFDWQHSMYNQPVYYRPGSWSLTNDLFWMRLQLYY